jgi:transcriptional regulator with XRE-family HTH domain
MSLSGICKKGLNYIPFQRLISFSIIVSFFLTSLGPLPKAHADADLGLPAPGAMINLSPAYQPVIIKGLTVHKDNPFLFDFIVDVGQDRMSGEPLKKEGEKLIKYFLASLAIPDKDVWVNLSPYEKNKMIPEALGQTDMGRDLLEQDYILKQITASLIYPENKLGKTFWDRVYAKAREMYGTTQIPVNTFNKVWIMADRAQVFEHNQTAFVVDSHLKVMLEEDYLALQKHNPSVIPTFSTVVIPAKAGIHSLSSQIIKEIVLPELEKEVNTGKNFANLRQIFNSIILSSWYKKNLKEALLNQVYVNKSKVNGVIASGAKQSREQIYEQYLKAYKKGVFNYIKEDVNNAGEMVPRKYFSGGIFEAGAAAHPLTEPVTQANSAQLDDSLPNPLADFAMLAITKPTAAQTLPTDAAMMGDQPNMAMSANYKTSGGMIKYFRKQKGLSRTELARRSGFVQKTGRGDGSVILRIESGESIANWGTLGEIAQALGLSDEQRKELFGLWDQDKLLKAEERKNRERSELGISLKKSREDLKLTMHEVAEMARVTEATISNYENREDQIPGLEPLKRLAKVYGLPEEEVLRLRSKMIKTDGTLGGRIRQRRIELELNQLDVFPDSIAILIERGKIFPSKRELQTIADKLRLDVNELLALRDKDQVRIANGGNDAAMSADQVVMGLSNMPLFVSMEAINMSQENKPDSAMLEHPILTIIVGLGLGVSLLVSLHLWLRSVSKRKRLELIKLVNFLGSSNTKATFEYIRKKYGEDVKAFAYLLAIKSLTVDRKSPLSSRQLLQYFGRNVEHDPMLVSGLMRAMAEFMRGAYGIDVVSEFVKETARNGDYKHLTIIQEAIAEARAKIKIARAKNDEAMSVEPNLKGGIDLNTSNGMQWTVSKDGKGVEMNVDPAMIERVRREGIDSLSPVIFRITPVTSIWPLVGLQAPAR